MQREHYYFLEALIPQAKFNTKSSQKLKIQTDQVKINDIFLKAGLGTVRLD